MKTLLTFLTLIAITFTLSAQKMMKPSVMVVPSDLWCNSHGYMHGNGDDIYPDYNIALLKDRDLINVISKINIIMSDRGFPLENLETALKTLKNETVERKLYTAKDGSSIQESLLDQLYRTASADIVLQLSWNINKVGPKNSITFNLQALDSYTTKQVAGAQGTGSPSFSADVPTLLEEAVVSHMDDFCDRLIQHFKDSKENGREISVDVLIGKNTSCDFSTEFNDYELAEVITKLIARNAVNHEFSKGPSTASMMQFKSVRMPVCDEDGVAMDAYSFGRNIARALKKSPYNLTSNVIAKGQGKTIIVIGED
ncbi:DUF6175 family protein [Duncaniella muris]|uniref:DUF6175 family protein n=2 Tax=Duncaniella muris TaxID=2094150 RepID=UPI00272E8684|nr:DUF6175 family protein [Duncaniella muris]